MAVCAGYSYAALDPICLADRGQAAGSQVGNPSNTVADMMVRMGLEKNACRVVDERIDVMLVFSTAFIVQSADRNVVILAYRGTEPVNLLNWLTSTQFTAQGPARIRLSFEPVDIHAGYYRNVSATSYEVLRVLRCALAGRSVLECSDEPGGEPPQVMPGTEPALYITGHSLGGAMASIMGLRLMGDPAYSDIAQKIRAVYTFGQPMIGSGAVAAAYEQIEASRRAPVYRYVHRDDPVPHFPPNTAGEYEHFGREFSYHEKWEESLEPAKQMENIAQFIGAVSDFPLRQFSTWRRLAWLLPPLHDRYTIADHMPQCYIDTLTPDNQVNEFGDDYVRLARPDLMGRPSNGHAGDFQDIERFVANIARTATRAVAETPSLATNGVAYIRRGIDRIPLL
jgi:hypothetical protein